MDKVILNITDPKEIKWPKRCPGCGKSLDPGADDLMIREHKTSSMKQGTIDIDHVRQGMLVKDTQELLSIWVKNNRELWRPEAFDVIESILAERGQPLPPQNKPFYRKDESIKQIDVKRSFAAWLTSKVPRTISITLCGRCSRRNPFATILKAIGAVVMSSAFLGFMFISRLPERYLNLGGPWLSLFLGSILWELGEGWRNRATGTKVRLHKDALVFRFRNKAFAADFRQHNSSRQPV